MSFQPSGQLMYLRERRIAAAAERDRILVVPTAEKRNLTEAEQSAFNTAIAEVKELDEAITATEQQDIRAQNARATQAQVRQGGWSSAAQVAGRGGEGVYRRGGEHSFFRDLAHAQRGDWSAAQRLSQHAEVVDRATIDGRFGQELRVNPNRVDGQGGWFVPPIYLIDEYVTLSRAGRVTADRFRRLPLPTGTDSINIPKVATGTATAVQTADAAAVQSTDMTDSVITAPVRTIAGQQDIAMQLLEQSPIAFDEVIFRDLLADYAQRLDIQCLNGSGSAGQMLGVLSVSGVNSITFTQASPTLPLLYPMILQAKAQVEKSVFMPADAIIMSPSRWNWILSILDSSNRPLASVDGAAFNTLAVSSNPNPAEGSVGHIAGLPVFTDANMPANLGAGTNEDRIIVGRFDESFLWEGVPRTRALMEVLSGTLQVRLQAYNYAACTAERRPKALSVIAGTGMVTTTVLAGF